MGVALLVLLLSGGGVFAWLASSSARNKAETGPQAATTAQAHTSATAAAGVTGLPASSTAASMPSHLTYRGHTSDVLALAWSPDGKRIAVAGGALQVWDASTGTPLLTYPGHTNYVEALVWSPDGKRIASGSVDSTVQVWDASTGKTLFTYRGHTSSVYAVAWSPDGKLIASGGADSTVQVWSVG